MKNIILKFSGGLETLFKEPVMDIDFPIAGGTLPQLVVWIRDNLVQERPSLFCDGDSIRPGILIVVNGADHALLEDDYVIKDNDEISFISTLHGG